MPHPLFLQEADPARAQSLALFLRTYWSVLLVPLLGFLAVYWLLPRARRSWPLYGAIAGGLALAAALFFLWHWGTGAVWPEKILFYAFAGVAVTSAVMMVTQSNPVHAALSFALVVLSSCGLFLLQGAPFLAAATIIIYAGAIVVTFLFVIMLAQQEGWSNADLRSREPFLATLAGMVLMAAILCVLQRDLDTSRLDRLIARLDRLAAAESADVVKQEMGDPAAIKRAGQTFTTHPLVDEIKIYLDARAKDRAEDARRRAEDARKHAEAATGPRKASLETVAKELEAQYLLIHVEEQSVLKAEHLETAWISVDRSLPALKADARVVAEALRRKRQLHGALALRTGEKGRAGDEIHVVVRRPDRQEAAPGVLPGRNVTALGRTLFTDYLIPVELAAVLLLVATIGAIAIASRHSEVLR